MSVTLCELAANGMRFRCREVGRGGVPVMLLHGFPETSCMWEPLLERLAMEGFHAVAPDQRGYSPGARPRGAEHYSYAALAADVFALADALGWQRFHLIGHDWGAGAGWAALAVNPARIASWSALSVPHLAAFGQVIRNDPDQGQRSEYMRFFLEPGAAEQAFAADDFAMLRQVWAEHHDAALQAEYLSVLSEPGALGAALDWYRGTRGMDPDDSEVRFDPVATPTLFLWGNRDVAIGRAAVDAAARWMVGSYRFVELDAGHWLMQEAPDAVIDAILGHLRAHPLR